MSITITFPQPAPLMSMNVKEHWAKKGGKVKLWRKAARDAAEQQAGALLAPSIVDLHLPIPDRRRRDPHNYAPVLKAVIDGLVDAGVWPDDTPEFVRTLEPTLYLTEPGDVPMVKVVITPRSAT